MAFEDVIGNEPIISSLKGLIAADTISHAYLFEGPDGIGKRLTALNFAKTIFCRQRYNGDACEVCISCKKLNHENHEDFHYITSDGNSIKDSQIEELQENMQKKPFESDRRVFIIDKADTMTVRAQNRLLKTLEDPPGKITIILLSENLGNIVPTILSRCIIYKFKPIPKRSVKEYLHKKYELNESEREVIASFSYGTIGRAEKLCTSETFNQRRELCNHIAAAIIKKEMLYHYHKELAEVTGNKEAALEFLDLVECWYRDLMIMKTPGSEQLILNADFKQLLADMSARLNGAGIVHIIDLIEEAKRDINMNISINYTIKNMFIKAQEETNG